MAALGAIKRIARLHHAALDQRAERDARLGAWRLGDAHRIAAGRLDFSEAGAGDFQIFGVAFNADIMAAETFGGGTGRARTEKGVEDEIARIGGREQDAVQQGFRLLRRMRLLAVITLEPLTTRTDRQRPVRAHLHAVIEGFHGGIIEGRAAILGLGGPDQGLVRIGEARALEIRHRIGLAPDDVIEDPEAGILEDAADAENIVIAADHPDGAIRLEHAARLLHPLPGEEVIIVETADLIPVIIDRVDLGIVGAVQIAAELEIIGRIGEDEIDAGIGKRFHHFDAFAFQNLINRGLHHNAPLHSSA